MSMYVRCYAKYLNEKLCSFRVMGYDFCKVKRGLVHVDRKLESFARWMDG